MEVEVLPGQMPQHHKWPRQQQLAALLAPDLATEVQVADFLSSSDLRNWPLVGSLICSIPPPAAAAGHADVSSSSGHQQNDGMGVAGAAAVKDSKGDTEIEFSSDSGSKDDDDDFAIGHEEQQQQQQHKHRKKQRTAGGDSPTKNNHSDALQAGTAAAAAADKGPGVQVKAQQLLADVVQRFNLNPAQVAVAAHIADWLPDLHQQQQQQVGSSKPPGLSKKHQAGTTGTYSSMQAAAAAGLNGDGASSSTSSSSSGNSRPPVCLIHGPFGSGKSTLLVALIHLLTGLSEVSSEKYSTPHVVFDGGVLGCVSDSCRSASPTVHCYRFISSTHCPLLAYLVLYSMLYGWIQMAAAAADLPGTASSRPNQQQKAQALRNLKRSKGPSYSCCCTYKRSSRQSPASPHGIRVHQYAEGGVAAAHCQEAAVLFTTFSR